MSDFALKEGKPASGIFSVIKAAVAYLVVPLVLIFLINSLVAQAGQIIPEEFRLNEITNSVLIFGIIISAISFFVGFYPKGSQSRFVFGVITVVMICIWIWFVTLGGQFSIDLGMGGATLDFAGLVYLFIFAASLKGVYYLAEMLTFRKEYVEKKPTIEVKDETKPQEVQQ